MRRVVYSQDKLVSEKDNFIWIYIDSTKEENKTWIDKYKNKTVPTAYFLTFDGKEASKISGVCKLEQFLDKLNKLKRKNKSVWDAEKKKREKENKAEEEKKPEEKKENKGS